MKPAITEAELAAYIAGKKSARRAMRIGGALAVVALLVSGVAFAAQYSGIDLLPRWMKAGAFIGTTATAADLNKLVDTRKGIAVWDFPALGGGGVACSDSATLTMTGVAFTDTCLASTDLGMDGGSAALYLNAKFSCRSVTNGVVFRACYDQADAGTPGTMDLPDAGLFARTFR